jgi:3-methylcrotonyl-CoA carboxylase alpha subunit
MSTQNYHTAIATTRLGKVEEIKVPTKDVEGDEVLIKVDSASVIAFDTYMSDIGYYVFEYPTVLGFNTAGTVVRLGKDIANTGDLAIGDRVYIHSLLR